MWKDDLIGTRRVRGGECEVELIDCLTSRGAIASLTLTLEGFLHVKVTLASHVFVFILLLMLLPHSAMEALSSPPNQIIVAQTLTLESKGIISPPIRPETAAPMPVAPPSRKSNAVHWRCCAWRRLLAQPGITHEPCVVVQLHCRNAVQPWLPRADLSQYRATPHQAMPPASLT